MEVEASDLLKVQFCREVNVDGTDVDAFDKGLSSLFWYLDILPLFSLVVKEVLLLLIVHDISIFFRNFSNQVQELK